MNRMLRRVFAAVLLIALAVGGWVGWRLWRVGASEAPVLRLRANHASEVTVLRGNPLIFTVYLSQAAPDARLRIGTRGRPWHSRVTLEAADTGRPVAWNLVPLGAESLAFAKDASGQVTMETSESDETIVDTDHLYEARFGLAPEETTRLKPGRYRLRASLDAPWWPLWNWHGHTVSAPISVTVLDGATPDLASRRVIDSIRFFLQTRRFEEARDRSLEILRNNRRSIDGYIFLGDALNGLRHDEEALKAYGDALAFIADRESAQPAGAREPPRYVLARVAEVEERIAQSSISHSQSAVPAPSAQRSTAEDPVVEYLVQHSGHAGWMGNRLKIYRSGLAVLYSTFGKEGAGSEKARLQLKPEEVEHLLLVMKEAKFVEFQDRYGREPTFNPGEMRIVYRWDGNTKQVTWRDAPSSPQPPAGWTRIVEVLDGIRNRLRPPSPGRTHFVED